MQRTICKPSNGFPSFVSHRVRIVLWAWPSLVVSWIPSRIPPPVVRPRCPALPCASFLPLHCASASSAALAWPPSRVVDEGVDLLQHGQRRQQAHCRRSFMHETPRCALLLRLHVPLRQLRAPDSRLGAAAAAACDSRAASCLLPPPPLPDRPASPRPRIEISSRSDPRLR